MWSFSIVFGFLAFEICTTSAADNPAHISLSHPAVPDGGGSCSKATDKWICSLGGECKAGKCVCDHWTTGAQCNLLNLEHLKRDVSTYGLQMRGYHSWGGHAVLDENGLWNGFFSFMCRHLSLSSWTTASSIVRATATSIDGPYTVQQMAVQPWAHNAYLTQDPSTNVCGVCVRVRACTDVIAFLCNAGLKAEVFASVLFQL